MTAPFEKVIPLRIVIPYWAWICPKRCSWGWTTEIRPRSSDIVVKVEDAERRCVGDENIRVFRNICIMLGLAVRDAVAHEHWDTIEFHTVNFHSGIAQVMDITVKPVNGGTVKTVIVVAANEYLLRTRKVAEPVHEIQRFLPAAVHGKVARMHNDVSLWQIVQPSVTAMRV